MAQTLYDYCQEHGKADLLCQWHPTKNGTLTPKALSYGSRKKVWWICERGHEWQAPVKSRSMGYGCPVCANRTVLPGENDLATTHPELAAQWHPTKNGALTPRDLVAGTRRKVWWQCERGHEWQAAVSSRAGGGAGCPVCTGKVVIPGENDLASRFPVIAAQWHPTKNGTLRPSDVSSFSNRKVWWRCPLGHDYRASVAARAVSSSACPYCTGRRVMAGFNDLATVEPEIAAQWHPTLNGGLTPQMVTAGSHKKVWWQCPEGHVWKAFIFSRAGQKRSGCPVCAGKAKSTRQDMYAAILMSKDSMMDDGRQ